MGTRNTYNPESVTHPGDILLESLEEKELGSKELAIRTGKPEKTISAILNGNSSITPDMAVLFEKVLKIPARFWLEAQRNYDEYNARKDYEERVLEAINWAKEAPYAMMAKLGWLPKTRTPREKVINLFDFFEVASVKGWNDYYLNQKSKIAFRISLSNQENAISIAAWLRKGEIQAKEINVGEFSAKIFKKKLADAKKIMCEQPKNFFHQLQSICFEAGVKVVYTPSLPRTSIHGSTRWINDCPLIQLTGRWKRNDIFWFTFFHEAGHILLHGKKYISLENIEYTGEIEEYEKEADSFASQWLLSDAQEQEILNNNQLSDDIICDFANKFSTHPAVIIGRLHHKGIISYKHGRNFFESLDFNN